MKVSPSSQVEILIFLVLLKFKVIMENDTFFSRKTIVNQPVFFLWKMSVCLNCQCFSECKSDYMWLGKLPPSKKVLVSWHLGKEAFPKSRTGTTGWRDKAPNISHATLVTQSPKQLSIATSVGNWEVSGAHRRPFSVPVPCLVWCWAFADLIIIWQAWKS